MSQKETDLAFMRFLHCVIHLLLIAALVWMLMNSIGSYQEYDRLFLSLLDPDPSACVNFSVALEDILGRKNDTAKQIMLYMMYLMALTVSMLLVALVAKSSALIILFTLFEVTVLVVNLVFPLLTPYCSVMVVIASTVLNVSYLCFHLLPLSSSRSKKAYVSPRRTTAERRQLMSQSNETSQTFDLELN